MNKNTFVIKNNNLIVYLSDDGTGVVNFKDTFKDDKLNKQTRLLNVLKITDKDNNFIQIRVSENNWIKFTLPFNHKELFVLPELFKLLKDIVFLSQICPDNQIYRFQFLDKQDIEKELIKVELEINKLFSQRVS